MNTHWNTHLPFITPIEFAVTGRTTGTLRIVEMQGNVLKITAKLDKWTWGAAPIKAYDGESELIIVNEKKLKAKGANKLTRKSFESDSITVNFQDGRFQIGSTEFKAAAEIVVVSSEMMTLELKIAGALGLLVRGPAQFQLKKL
jgi:hypothetical protein